MNMPRNILLRLVAPVVVMVSVGIAGWLVVRGGGAEGSASGDDEGPVVTVPVERRVLEALQVTRGTVLAPSQATVLAGAPGEGELAVVVTGLPVPLGSDVTAGGVAVEINGRPVFALPGEIPVYRDMRPGDVGPDVAAVQESLRSLGYLVADTERAAETFGYSTQRAIRSLYENAGYGPAYTLGSRDAVVEAESQADAAVDTAQAALDAAAAGSPDDATAAPPGAVPASSEAVGAAQNALDDAVAARNRVRASEGVMLPAREFVAVPSLPASIVELPVRVGESVDAGMPVATIGSNQFRVRIELTSAQVNELADDVEISVFSDRGYEATCVPAEPRVETAADGGEANGDVAAPAADAGDSPDEETPGGGTDSGSGAGATSSDAYVMDVVCDPLPPADSLGTSLRVTMTMRRSDGEVLVVPATAVSTTPSGDVAVEVIGSDGQSTRVEVTMGGEADGFVAVTPVDDGALTEGMDVRVRGS